MTTPADQPSNRDPLRLAFFALGAAFFGIAVLDRILAIAGGFSSLLLTAMRRRPYAIARVAALWWPVVRHGPESNEKRQAFNNAAIA